MSYIKFADLYKQVELLRKILQRPIGLASKQGFFKFQINSIHINYSARKKIIRIREILANLPVLSVLLNTFYRPSKISKSALAMGTCAEKNEEQPSPPHKSLLGGDTLKVFREVIY